VGRVRFLVLDLRSESEDTQDSTNWDDASKATMLGAAQKEWLREELEAHASWGMIVLVSSKPWTGAEDKEKCCKWMNYPEERVEVAEMIKATGALNVVMTAGDSHMVAYDDGSNTDFAAGGGAGFPLLHSAPLHQVNSYKGGPYSNGCFARQVTVGEYMQWYMTLGRDSPSTHQFSVMEVTDTGGALADGPISFKAIGYEYDDATGKAVRMEGAEIELAGPEFVKLGANSDGVCEQKADDDSNEQTARILVALIVFFVTVLCGMCCQFMACRRVCCYDPHKEK